jgi:thiol:disulfide interchange protein
MMLRLPKEANRSRLTVVGAALLAIVLIAATVEVIKGPRGSEWHTDIYAARRQAIASGKLLLVDFGAAWCSPCNRMKETTLKDNSVLQRLQRYVLVSVDIDADPNTARSMNVESVPAFFVLDPRDGKILKENRDGFLTSDEFVAWLDK